MHLSADISSAQQQIEAVRRGIDECDDPKLQMQTANSINTILDILQDPIFQTIVHVQDSLSELNAQITQHPSMLPNDFDIDMTGNLILCVNGGDVIYDIDERLPSTELTISPIANSPGSSKNVNDMDQLSKEHHKKMPSLSGVELFSSDYVQIQAIELVNDGTGLGFGIIGARNSGVIVKTILPGGVADRDGRLRSGDHILQIGDVNLQEMVSEQVAAVLRQSGTHVRLVVGRAMEQTTSLDSIPEFSLEPGCAVVPARVLADRAELERYLISTGYPEIFGESSNASTPQTTTEDERFIYHGNNNNHKYPIMNSANGLSNLLNLPETEKLHVELTKDVNGLGITIAGYVCEKEELSGIFVKSVSPGSAADLNGRIRVNDRIIEVDGQSLQGFSNHQAVELLKKSGQIVNLRLERYLRGPKYEQLQQAIAANDKIPSSVSSTPLRSTLQISSTTSLPQKKLCTANTKNDTCFSKDSDIRDLLPNNEASTLVSDQNKLKVSGSSPIPCSTIADSIESEYKRTSACNIEDIQNIIVDKSLCLHDKTGSDIFNLKESTYTPNPALLTRQICYAEPDLNTEVEQEIKRKWKKILGPGIDIIVAQITKFTVGGLGISLEGTVDVEGGREVRPHHYIRSILSDGPVGVNGKLRAGDELLEVNGERLFGMNHLEVVAILKELPQHVCMVCGRGKNQLMSISDGTLKKLEGNFESLLPTCDRLVKAKSDGNLAIAHSDNDESFKIKSRSLEPLTGLAMWSSEPQIIELIKGDRGLGFSILDYQDPLDSNDCLIVIRSLVPGGVAQLDGRLIPGDRLLFVNSINLENATLDQAVQALKGAPKGVVRIGVAKPLPLTDNSLKIGINTSGISSGITTDAKTPERDLIATWKK